MREIVGYFFSVENCCNEIL